MISARQTVQTKNIISRIFRLSIIKLSVRIFAAETMYRCTHTRCNAAVKNPQGLLRYCDIVRVYAALPTLPFLRCPSRKVRAAPAAAIIMCG